MQPVSACSTAIAIGFQRWHAFDFSVRLTGIGRLFQPTGSAGGKRTFGRLVSPNQVQPYKNQSGNSGVMAFELRATSVILQFQNGGKYEYTAKKPGAAAVAKIKRLAIAGRGLSTFISREVKSAYARKVR